MSIQDAIADNVVWLETSVDINFLKHYDNNLDKFLSDISGLVSKYKKQIEIRPEVGISKTLDRDFIRTWVYPLFESKIFNNVDVYGPEVFDGIEDFVYIFKLAEKYNIKRKRMSENFLMHNLSAALLSFLIWMKYSTVSEPLPTIRC